MPESQKLLHILKAPMEDTTLDQRRLIRFVKPSEKLVDKTRHEFVTLTEVRILPFGSLKGQT